MSVDWFVLDGLWEAEQYVGKVLGKKQGCAYSADDCFA